MQPIFKKSDSNMINDETFSSRDDDLLEALELNAKLLSHFAFYETNNFSEFAFETNQTHVVVGYIMDRLVQEGSKKLYDKYIGTKLPNHVLGVSKEYLEMLNEMEFQPHDECDVGIDSLAEDMEPVSHAQDSWVRNKINIEKKLPNISDEVQREKGDKQNEVEASESKHSWMKSNASKIVKDKSDIIKEAKKNEMKPVMLPDEIKTVFDPLEEQVRMKKEREMKLKEEKSQEAKQRLEEVKEQQYKLKGMNNENSKKNYTYDFEGNIIPFQPVKVEKLPPSNYSMNVAFSTFDPNAKGEDDKNKKKDKNAQQKVLAPIPRPQQKTTIEQGKFIASPTIFDAFNANPGVTLIEGGRTKTFTGTKQEKSAFTIISLSTNLNETNPIRLSKNEYMQLTRGGNLSRSQNYSSSTTEKEKKQGKLGDEPSKNILTRENMIEGGNTSNISEGMKDLNIQMSRMKHKKHDSKENNIKVSSNKMLSSLVEEVNLMDSMSFKGAMEKPEKKEEIYKTPIDEFNLHILRSKDWGKSSTGSGFLPILKTGFKPASKDFERSLGKKAKNPRERAIKGINLREGEYLGPPMIGKVAGHGINISGMS